MKANEFWMRMREAESDLGEDWVNIGAEMYNVKELFIFIRDNMPNLYEYYKNVYVDLGLDLDKELLLDNVSSDGLFADDEFSEDVSIELAQYITDEPVECWNLYIAIQAIAAETQPEICKELDEFLKELGF